MILFYLILPFVVFAVIRLLVALFNFITSPTLRATKPISDNMVSVLIPVQNEEKNIENLLIDILDQTYTNIEVIVYNDRSVDSTSQVVLEYSKNNRNISLISGTDLPEGWGGKNYSCHNLAQRAKGDYLIFLDAKVRLKPEFIENSLGFMQKNRLALLSIFPNQIIKTLGERIVVPLIQWIFISLLPLRLVQWSRKSFLSAASEQMMMFKADIYRKYQWHEQFKEKLFASNYISKSVKISQYRAATLLGSENDIRSREYNSYNETINGLSSGICDFFLGNHRVMIGLAAITFFSPILIAFIMPFPLIFAYFFSVIMARLLVAQLSKQSLVLSVLLLPLQQYAFIQIVRKWMKVSNYRIFTMKGRKISPEQ
ncbi:MAG: glycosyltransferase family 2 protein [Bacteroidales bacterium]